MNQNQSSICVVCDENIACIDDYLGKHHNINVIKLAGRQIDQNTLDKYRPDALFIRSVSQINSKIFNRLHQLKFVGSATIGTDHVDKDFLQKNNITFGNAKGCSKHSVAQYVITAILTLYPDYLSKKITLGIIGLGNIGSTLAHYAQDLNWQILGYDPFLEKSELNNSDFKDLLNHSDVVSIHTPLTKNTAYPTYQLFNKSTLTHLKNHALLINSARGEIICQNDLIESIVDKKIKTVLDVFPFEPNIDNNLLNSLTIATPHIAGYTLEGKIRGTDIIYQKFCQTFNLPIKQTIESLLPNNPYHWQILKNDLSLLPNYYDIYHDDKKLRNIDSQYNFGKQFDLLRKDYPLKREWLFNE